MLKRCCGTGADDSALRLMIAAVQVDVRRDGLVDAVDALQFLEKKVGTVNAEVLGQIVNEEGNALFKRASQINDNTINPETLLHASYEILGELDWESIQPQIKKLDWEHVRKIFPDDVEEFPDISDRTDGGTDGELRSIAGFWLQRDLCLNLPYKPSENQPPQQIKKEEIDDIVLDTKLDINIRNTKQKETRDEQLKILEKVNQFVWQQKPRPPGDGAFLKLKPEFKEFLSDLTTTQQRRNDNYSVALTTFREKYARFVQARNDRLQQNKEDFLKEKQAAGCVLTDELANRVVALVVECIAFDLVSAH